MVKSANLASFLFFLSLSFYFSASILSASHSGFLAASQAVPGTFCLHVVPAVAHTSPLDPTAKWPSESESALSILLGFSFFTEHFPIPSAL